VDHLGCGEDLGAGPLGGIPPHGVATETEHRFKALRHGMEGALLLSLQLLRGAGVVVRRVAPSSSQSCPTATRA